MELKRFADEGGQQALAHNTACATGQRNATKPITVKETSADKLLEEASRVDFSNWVNELYVHLDGVDGWSGVSALLQEIRAEKTTLTEDNLTHCA